MKLFVVLALIACSYADKLDRTYLPPANAATAGGIPGSLDAPGIDSESLLGQGLPSSFGQTNGPTNVGSTAVFGNKQNTKSVFDQNSGLSAVSGPSNTDQIGNGIDDLNRPATSGFKQSPIQNFNPKSTQNFGFISNTNQDEANQGLRPDVPEPNFFPQTYTPERAQAAADKNSEILRNVNENDGETFSYSFETSNGISAEEYGVAINGVKAQGGFSYTGDDGKEYSITYTADENGYLPQGEHLPTPHPIPEEILKSIEKNAKAAAAGNQEGAYRPEEYESENYPQQYNNGASNRKTQGQGTSTIQSQAAPYNYERPLNQGQMQQGLLGDNNRITASTITQKKPSHESNQFPTGSVPQQAQFNQYSQSPDSVHNGLPNLQTDQTNIQGFGQQERGQESNGYDYNRPGANSLTQGPLGQQNLQSVQQSQRNISPKPNIPSFGSQSNQEAYRPFSDNQKPALGSASRSRYQSNMNQPSLASDQPPSQSFPSKSIIQDLGSTFPSRPVYQLNQNQQTFGLNSPHQNTPQYEPINQNFGSAPSTQNKVSSSLISSEAEAGYQYKRPSQSFSSPSQISMQNNHATQSALTSPSQTLPRYKPSQSSLTSSPSSRPSQVPSQYNRPAKPLLTSPSQAPSQNKPGQYSLTSSQSLSEPQTPYQYNRPVQSSFTVPSQTPSQYKPGQSSLSSSPSSSPSQVPSQYSRPAQSSFTSPSQINSQYKPDKSSLTSSPSSSSSQTPYQYNRPTQSSLTPQSQASSQYKTNQASLTSLLSSSSSQVPSQYNRPVQSSFTSLPQTTSQNKPDQSSLTSSPSSSPSQTPYQYNRPAQSSFTSPPQASSQYKPDQSLGQSQDSSQYNRPSQNSFSSPSQTPSQYKPVQPMITPSQSSSPSQTPYQYDRPGQSLTTSPFQRPSGNGIASQPFNASEGFQVKPEQFGGPRQPPSYSPEEGYKY